MSQNRQIHAHTSWTRVVYTTVSVRYITNPVPSHNLWTYQRSWFLSAALVQYIWQTGRRVSQLIGQVCVQWTIYHYDVKGEKVGIILFTWKRHVSMSLNYTKAYVSVYLMLTFPPKRM